MVELFIAYRHIKERKFQTIISITAISLALVVFITSLAVSGGLTKNTLNSLLSLNPHLTVKYIDQSENEYENTISNINDSEIINKTAAIDIQGFIKYDGQNIIPLIKATDIGSLNVNIEDGNLLSSDLDTVVIGEELRKSIGANIGDNINVLSLKGKEIRLRLVATFKTGFLPYDSNLVIVPLEVGKILNEVGNKITSININVKNPSDITKLDKLKNEIILKDSNLYAYTWADENSNLLSAIRIEKFILITILSFLFIIASFVVAVILNISVREKTNDIGILKAFGYTKQNIMKIFLFEGIFVAISGIVVSMILSPIAIKGLSLLSETILGNTYYLSKLPIDIKLSEVLIIYLVSLVLVFLASIIPARNAAKLDTTQAIKFNL
ncbi:ABC transporter permease [Oceanivirga salmonicida]|uniref:ABC transporter permease n=1 Tax=Oceanivirga salmonicida TaxID=1769291 RepID=UPI0008312192|nr:FtsX-like permease family protein [Oceanivirga salmonicida]